MKKGWIIVLCLLCTVNLLAKTKVEKGVIIGLNLANLEGDWHKNSKIKAGVTAGFFIKIKMTDNFSLSPEIYYTIKGSENKYPLEEDPNETKFNETYSYVEMPLLASYSILSNNRFNIELIGGPVVSYLVETKWELFLNDQQTTETDVDNFTKKVDFGGLIGTNFNFIVSGQTLIIGFRYIHGLSTINDSKPQLDMKNKVFTIIGGFSF